MMKRKAYTAFGETGIGEMGHKINCQWSVYDLLVIALTINT